MKRIRNRKFLKARRMQYSLLLRVYRMSMQEFFQTASELKDEAEFEGRVAAKLAEMHQHIQSWGGVCDECPAYNECSETPSCKSKFLKYARLAVEEKMDADARRKRLA